MLISPALQRGVSAVEIESSPVGTMPRPLPEHISIVVLDSAIAKQGDKFLFKVTFAVMLLLVLNVFLHHRNLRRDDAECSVTFLPGKAMPHPPGGASLEFLNGSGKGVRCRQDKEQMNVIRRSAGGQERRALAAGNAAEVGKEFGLACFGNQRAAIFRAENTMNKIACIRMRHLAPSLRDSHSTTAIYTPR